jgi:hypothetical protein
MAYYEALQVNWRFSMKIATENIQTAKSKICLLQYLLYQAFNKYVASCHSLLDPKHSEESQKR